MKKVKSEQRRTRRGEREVESEKRRARGGARRGEREEESVGLVIRYTPSDLRMAVWGAIATVKWRQGERRHAGRHFVYDEGC